MQLDDFAAPDGVNPALAGIAWMIGSWEGTGHCHEPGDEQPFEIEQRVDFSHNGGDYLFYASQWFRLGKDGAERDPLGMESGFWHPQADASLDVVLCNAEGRAEVLGGAIQVTRIDLVTDAVARTVNSTVAYTGGSRLYGLVEGDLMYAHDRATEGAPLAPYMWARLKRA